MNKDAMSEHGEPDIYGGVTYRWGRTDWEVVDDLLADGWKYEDAVRFSAEKRH